GVVRGEDPRAAPAPPVDSRAGAALVCARDLIPAATGQHDAGRLRDLVCEPAGGVVFGSAGPGPVVPRARGEAVEGHRDVYENHAVPGTVFEVKTHRSPVQGNRRFSP